jgi:hypothetical protein
MASSAVIDEEVEAACRKFCAFYWLTDGHDFCMGGWKDHPDGVRRPTCICWRPRLRMTREALEAAAEAREALAISQ